MLFKSRQSNRVRDQLRRSVWPPSAWGRVTRYVWHRAARIEASSHSIALGCSLGIFAAFTPFLGLHTVMAMLCAWVLGGNVVAAAIGAQAGNPLTFPFIWLATYETGQLFLGGEAAGSQPMAQMSWTAFNWQSLETVTHIFLPMFVGSMLLGILAGTLTYYPVRAAVSSYQAKRLERRFLRGEKPSGADEESVQIGLNGLDE